MPLPHPDMFDRLAQNEFEITQRWHQLAYRFKRPAELLADDTVDGQVRAVVQWVEVTFAMLAQYSKR